MKSKALILGGVALALIAATALVLARSASGRALGQPGLKLTESVGTNGVLVALPVQVTGFESRPVDVSEAERNMLPKDTTFGKRIYRASDGFEVGVNAVMMGTDRTSIHKPEFCLPGQGFTIDKEEMETVRIPGPVAYDLKVRKFTCSRDLRMQDGRTTKVRALYVFWFVSDGELATNPWEMMWLSARDLVSTGQLRRWAYVSCFSMFPVGMEAPAWKRMQEFIALSVPQFQTTTGPTALAQAARP
jgi:hypothetical protein